MKRIIIKNIGPLKEADIELGKVNVIIGPQSSGKSCVLKIACYCSWVEKRIELAQTDAYFQEKGRFRDELVRFHKLKGYFREDSSVAYESDYMRFSYRAENDEFTFAWKKGRWEYRRPKVTYIPAERNMVAAIPNWFDVKFNNDNIQNFMADWDRARKNLTAPMQILNLGVAYQYDEQANSDKVQVDDGVTLELTNTSSGLQSLIPLFVHLNYVGTALYQQEEAQSYSDKQMGEQFLRIMYEELFEKTGKTEIEREDVKKGQDNKVVKPFALEPIGPFILWFTDYQYAEECRSIYNRYVKTDHSEIFLEEPENSLFPPTQTRLVDWLLQMTEGEHGASLFVATHSPYMMTAFLEKELTDFKLFFEKKEGKHSVVVTASAEDVQEIYDDGIDVFYNIESYI